MFEPTYVGCYKFRENPMFLTISIDLDASGFLQVIKTRLMDAIGFLQLSKMEPIDAFSFLQMSFGRLVAASAFL